MPLFRATAEIFTIEEKRAAKSINDFQIREMYATMKAFLKACLPKIPVRTGFLKSAFGPMKRFFLGGQASGDLNPDLQALFFGDEKPYKPGSAAREVLNKLQTTNSRGEKLSAAGQAARQRAYKEELRKNLRRWRKTKAGRQVKDSRLVEYYYEGKRRFAKTPSNAIKLVSPQDPGDILQGRGLTTTLQFDIRISYYRINDFFHRITGSPWRSLDAGFQAALNYLENAARRYPFLSEVLVTQRIYLRGSQVVKGSVGQNNQVADYRGRFGSSFYPTSGNLIPENSIPQISKPQEDNFGYGFLGNS